MNINNNINNEYISNSSIIKSILNTLKELRKKINTKFLNITRNNENSINDLIVDLKNSFNDVGNILFETDFFSNEYYDFSSIRDMVFYILDNNLLEYIPSFTDLLNSFYDIILSKINLSYDEYEEKYENFSFKLIDVEQVFYTEICEPSEKYDEKALSEILNAFFG